MMNKVNINNFREICSKNSSQDDALEEYTRKIIEQCARAVANAELPAHFQWGEEAREHFEYGKFRAYRAILELKP